MAPLGHLFTLPASWFEGAAVHQHHQAPPAEASSTAASAEAGPFASGQSISQTAAGPNANTTQESQSQPAGQHKEIGSGSTCLTCGIGVSLPAFASSAEQRAHFKTDWHRLNVKRRLGKQAPLSEEAFEALMARQQPENALADGAASEVSISGGESSGEEDEETSEGGGRGGRAGPGKVPQVTFCSADGTPFAVWRCLLARDKDKDKEAAWQADAADQHKAMLQELKRLRKSAGMWVVLLLRGGHFAGTVFRAKQGRAGAGPGSLEGFEVVEHKTFHRYVVRAKAGGKQSSQDASGKYARSAGAALRRYNESALEQDIADLLASWAPHLRAADLIFMQATSSNMRTLMDAAATASASLVPGSGSAPPAPLLADDARVRKVPFVTRRPTYAETKRVVSLLAAVLKPGAEAAASMLEAKRSEALEAEEAAAAAAAAELSALTLTPAGLASIQAQQRTAQQEAAAAEAAAEAVRRETERALDTPLHKASRQGEWERVVRLLAAGGGAVHNPAARDARGRTPYALAADKNTRDAFRRAMADDVGSEEAPGPRRWDWVAAGVPSALTADMEASQAAKKADKRAKQRAGKDKDEDKAAKEKAAAEAKAAALDAEIAAAMAEANALSARMAASSSRAPPRGASAQGPAGKVGAGASGSGKGAGSGKAGSKAAGGGKGGAGSAAAPAPPPSAEELARRREMMAAAAEARAKALQQATQAQKLW